MTHYEKQYEYSCNYCPHATYNELDMKDHLRTQHEEVQDQ